MFIKLNSQGVKSIEGFIVQFVGRNEIQYKEGEHILSIFIEGGVDKQKKYFEYIYVSLISKWLPPYDMEEIQKEKKDKIIENVKKALDFLGIAHTVC